jgi:hypothetical protein
MQNIQKMDRTLVSEDYDTWKIVALELGMDAEELGAVDTVRMRLLGAAAIACDVLGSQSKTAYMCSESVWWKCHRRIISDYLVTAKGIEILHIMHDGREVPHKPMDGLRMRDDGLIVYNLAGQMN